MSEDQLRDYRARLSATIAAIDELADFRALDDDDSSPATESLPPAHESSPPATESSPPVTESSPPVPESSSPVPESSSPAPESSPPVTESSPPEQDSGKFGQSPASLILTLLHRHIEMKESELRKFGQEPTVGGAGNPGAEQSLQP